MRILHFILIFISTAILAQNQRFVYEYTFKPDSLNRQNIVKETMNLDITKEKSNFYSHLLISNDSLFNAEYEKGKAKQFLSIDMRKMKKSNVRFRVSKKYPNFETFYHTSINAENFVIKETNKIDWKILPETNNIEGFKVQKAATSFGGRNWIAWFSSEIPMQEGPYKFCGLPGLILAIEDEKGDHVFRFLGNQKLDSEPVIYDLKKQEITVDEKKFNSLWNDFKKDPAKNIKQLHSASEMSETLFYDASGSPMSKQDLIKNKEENANKYFKHHNNFIELSLYK